MRLYHWPAAPAAHRSTRPIRVAAAPMRAERHPGFVGIPMAERPPRAADRYVSVDIPRRVAEPFRVEDGRYLLPASVVLAYQARGRRSAGDSRSG